MAGAWNWIWREDGARRVMAVVALVGLLFAVASAWNGQCVATDQNSEDILLLRRDVDAMQQTQTEMMRTLDVIETDVGWLRDLFERGGQI